LFRCSRSLLFVRCALFDSVVVLRCSAVTLLRFVRIPLFHVDCALFVILTFSRLRVMRLLPFGCSLLFVAPFTFVYRIRLPFVCVTFLLIPFVRCFSPLIWFPDRCLHIVVLGCLCYVVRCCVVVRYVYRSVVTLRCSVCCYVVGCYLRCSFVCSRSTFGYHVRSLFTCRLLLLFVFVVLTGYVVHVVVPLRSFTLPLLVVRRFFSTRLRFAVVPAFRCVCSLLICYTGRSFVTPFLDFAFLRVRFGWFCSLFYVFVPTFVLFSRCSLFTLFLRCRSVTLIPGPLLPAFVPVFFYLRLRWLRCYWLRSVVRSLRFVVIHLRSRFTFVLVCSRALRCYVLRGYVFVAFGLRFRSLRSRLV
jgi:hypothetical protein